MDSLSSTNLMLFFTAGSSLATWRNTGTLLRESRVYRKLLPHVRAVSFVTYGGKDDMALAAELGGIRVRCNRWGLHPRLWRTALAHLAPRLWPRPAIFKSNQAPGAEVMLTAARAARARSIARAGYLPSNIAAWARGEESTEARGMRRLERHVFRGADRAVVTTESMAETLRRRYQVEAAKIRVIPNYVDTDAFSPAAGRPAEGRLVFVGRLHREKNLGALLEALTGMEVELVLAGEGELRPELEDQARRLGLNARFLGAVPNSDLPALIASAQAFVFPSLGEHHPKALIEAMSAGAAVVACDVPGVDELVSHGRTGWLCGTSPSDLAQAVGHVLGDDRLRREMGRAARELCVARFSLERVAGLELDLLRELSQ